MSNKKVCHLASYRKVSSEVHDPWYSPDLPPAIVSTKNSYLTDLWAIYSPWMAAVSYCFYFQAELRSPWWMPPAREPAWSAASQSSVSGTSPVWTCGPRPAPEMWLFVKTERNLWTILQEKWYQFLRCTDCKALWASGGGHIPPSDSLHISPYLTPSCISNIILNTRLEPASAANVPAGTFIIFQ